jgi:DNA-binding MarR family transcriptional regulator
MRRPERQRSRAQTARAPAAPGRTGAVPSLREADYARLAAFRQTLRAFLHFSEAAARHVGLTAQHYQAMLALRGAPPDTRLTINDLARQLLIRHNSAVGLVDRLAVQGLVARKRAALDRRKVELLLTARGERLLERLAGVHQQELHRVGPLLDRLLRALVNDAQRV